MHAQRAISAWLQPNRAIFCSQKGPELPHLTLLKCTPSSALWHLSLGSAMGSCSGCHGKGLFPLGHLLPVAFCPCDSLDKRISQALVHHFLFCTYLCAGVWACLVFMKFWCVVWKKNIPQCCRSSAALRASLRDRAGTPDRFTLPQATIFLTLFLMKMWPESSWGL